MPKTIATADSLISSSFHLGHLCARKEMKFDQGNEAIGKTKPYCQTSITVL